MAVKILELLKTVITLSEDLKRSREEIKTLSSQLNTLTKEVLELKSKFEYFIQNEFKAFSERETLHREKFSKAERHEREKFMQEVNNIFAQAENKYLRSQLEELSRSPSDRPTKKELGAGKLNPTPDAD